MTPRHGPRTIQTPPQITMNKHISLPAWFLLMASVSAVAQPVPTAPIQTPSAPAGTGPLSTPKAVEQEAAIVKRLPYGAGFESRQQVRVHGGGGGMGHKR